MVIKKKQFFEIPKTSVISDIFNVTVLWLNFFSLRVVFFVMEKINTLNANDEHE